MGANNLLVMPGTAASGGVSFGVGQRHDPDAPGLRRPSRENAPPSTAATPVVRARTQVIYGNKNWVPIYIYGTTPAFLDVRDWTTWPKASCSPTRTSATAARSACWARRIVNELFNGESPVGKEIRVNNVAFKVIGVLTAKGANMMGMDQDDILLAPWTTIKYRVSGTSASTANQSSQTSSSTSSTVRHPAGQHPEPDLSQHARQPLSHGRPPPSRPTRRCRCASANIDQILAAARSTADIPAGHPADHPDPAASGTASSAGDAEDFTVRDMTEMTRALTSTADHDDQAAPGAWP